MNQNESPTLHQQIFEVAETISGCKPEEVALFIASADFYTREFLRQLGSSWKEALRVAKKTGEEDNKTRVVTIGLSLKQDFTNLGALKAEINLNVTPWKLKLSGKADEDLSQLQLDFDHGTITYTEDVEAENSLPAGHDEVLDGLDKENLDTLHQIAKDENVNIPKKSKKEDIIQAIRDKRKITPMPAAA